jgi:ribosome biogenesis SPOUT family RNA methylase Rps3
MDMLKNDEKNLYIVEHLDPELGPWSVLEYRAIAEESEVQNVKFCLTSFPKDLGLPSELQDTRSLVVEHRGVEDIFQATKERVCLLDPAASAELSPEDGGKFDVFLFGGILGMDIAYRRASMDG